MLSFTDVPAPRGRLKHGNPPGDPSTAPRCGAKAKRTGLPCRAPACRGKRRCRLHGTKDGRGPRAQPASPMETRRLLGRVPSEILARKGEVPSLQRGGARTLRPHHGQYEGATAPANDREQKPATTAETRATAGLAETDLKRGFRSRFSGSVEDQPHTPRDEDLT